jgi:large subunit ribosomal protein L22
MGKPKRARALPENKAMAVARNLRVSPRKLNLVAGLIRGKKVDHALADLEFSRKRIAQDVRKCVMSAVANAENNHQLDVNDLVVSEAYVGKNLIMKRFAARGRGRSSAIMKPFSQITVVVRQTDEEEADKKRAKKDKGEAQSTGQGAAKSGRGAKDTKASGGAKAGKAAAAKTSKGGKSAKETA